MIQDALRRHRPKAESALAPWPNPATLDQAALVTLLRRAKTPSDPHQGRIAGFVLSHGLWIMLGDLHVGLLRCFDYLGVP